MALYPKAKLALIPENATQPSIRPRAIVLHSAGSGGELEDWWNNPASSGLESHFWIGWDGEVYQYIDTEVRADANYKANGFAISIETASTPYATEPWNAAQVKAIVELVDWLCDEHDIPRVRIPTPYGAGIGWHIMFGAPGPWTPVSKACPGVQRIKQMTSTIIPQVRDLASEGDILAAISEARFASLERKVDALFDQLIGTKGDAPREALRQLLRETAQSAQAAEVQTRPGK